MTSPACAFRSLIDFMLHLSAVSLVTTMASLSSAADLSSTVRLLGNAFSSAAYTWSGPAPVEPGCWASGLLDAFSEEPQAAMVSAATTAVATPANVRIFKGSLLTNSLPGSDFPACARRAGGSWYYAGPARPPGVALRRAA